LDCTSEELAEISHREFQGFINADVIIVLLPNCGKGTYAELGGAIVLCERGMNKKIYLYSDDPKVFDVSEKTAAMYHNAYINRRTAAWKK